MSYETQLRYNFDTASNGRVFPSRSLHLFRSLQLFLRNTVIKALLYRWLVAKYIAGFTQALTIIDK